MLTLAKKKETVEPRKDGFLAPLDSQDFNTETPEIQKLDQQIKQKALQISELERQAEEKRKLKEQTQRNFETLELDYFRPNPKATEQQVESARREIEEAEIHIKHQRGKIIEAKEELALLEQKKEQRSAEIFQSVKTAFKKAMYEAEKLHVESLERAQETALRIRELNQINSGHRFSVLGQTFFEKNSYLDEGSRAHGLAYRLEMYLRTAVENLKKRAAELED